MATDSSLTPAERRRRARSGISVGSGAPSFDDAASSDRAFGRRVVPSRAERSSSRIDERSGNGFLVAIFLVCLVLPFYFHLGPLRLSPYRLFLLVVTIPLLIRWMTGGAGRILPCDLLVLGFALWQALSFSIVHGLAASIEASGIAFVETMGAYLLARIFIRGPEDFDLFVRTLFWIVVFLLPFAAFEALQGFAPIKGLFGSVFSTPGTYASEQRLGLWRASVTFEHPILFGVFCSTCVGLFIFALRRRDGRPGGVSRGAVAGAAAFFSLSMGGLLPVMLQGAILAWDRLFSTSERRWTILIILSVLAYIVVDILSNRTPFHVLVDRLTFNTHTAYWRIHIFNFGMDNVWANPFFGHGFNDWERPDWMHSGSVDNFWLATAMRNGIPAFLFVAAAVLWVLWRLGRLNLPEGPLALQRKGLLVSLVALSIAIGTVHLWNASFVFLMVLLGSGLWLVDWPAEKTEAASDALNDAATRRSRVSTNRGGAAPVRRREGLRSPRRA